jgi:hypothetical protein
LDLKNNGIKTTATVTGIVNAKGKGIKGSGGGIYYKYEFITTDSIKYEGLNTNHIYLGKKYSLGDKVNILYSSVNPYRNRIDSFDELFLLPLASGITSIIVFVFFLSLYFNCGWCLASVKIKLSSVTNH